ncbi:MAG: hypothetical protein AAFR59_05930, partial [Bacteroidota bacterium]
MKINTLLLSIGIVFTLLSCSREEPQFESPLNVKDTYLTIFERPNQRMPLGTIEANATLGDIRFQLIHQTPANALQIDPTSGLITVNDSSLFNIRERSSVSAEVEVSDSLHTERIQVFVTLSLAETTISYFKDVALGFEFGTSPEITRKWATSMKVFVDGNPTPPLIEVLDTAIQQINALATDGFFIEKVDERYKSNCYILFGTN